MPQFSFALNTSTIRPASLADKIRIAGQAGYDGIELWADDVKKHVAVGHKLADVRKLLDDQGLDRPSMISLNGWCAADEAGWGKAKEAAKRRLELARELGVRRIVASPPGEEVEQQLATARYGELLDLSLDYGVPASVEFLGFVKGINTLEKAWAICASVGNPQGTVTPDVWHMFRGGTQAAALDAVPADHISCFHWNDAPAQPRREEQTDADRVYPGDGVVDLKLIVRQLLKKPYNGVLSLELFNRTYWEQDPLMVAQTGLARMKRSVAGV